MFWCLVVKLLCSFIMFWCIIVMLLYSLIMLWCSTERSLCSLNMLFHYDVSLSFFKCHYIVFVDNYFHLNDTSSFKLKCYHGVPDAIIYFRLALYDLHIHEVFSENHFIFSLRRAAW